MIERKKICISGTHGFIGSHLIKKISDYVTIDSKSFNSLKNLEEKLEGVDVIVHLGGVIQGTEEEQVRGNVENTEKLLKIISKARKKPTLIFASTFAVYGVQENILTETSPINPRNSYGKSKAMTEELIVDFASKNNFPVIILRFSNVYGPGMEPNKHSVVANFIYQAINNQALNINGNGEQRRDFVFIKDVVHALQRAIKLSTNLKKIEILNICSGEAISLNQLIEEIERVVDRKLQVNYTNKDIVENGNWIGNNAKAYSVLKWSPKNSFKEGIKMTYEEKNK